MAKIQHVLFFVLALLMLTACGSKGDLYQVVEPEVVPNTTVSAPQTSDSETKKKQP